MIVVVPNRRGLWARIRAHPLWPRSPLYAGATLARAARNDVHSLSLRQRPLHTADPLPHAAVIGRRLGEYRPALVYLVRRRRRLRIEQADLCRPKHLGHRQRPAAPRLSAGRHPLKSQRASGQRVSLPARAHAVATIVQRRSEVPTPTPSRSSMRRRAAGYRKPANISGAPRASILRRRSDAVFRRFDNF